ncbi:MAG TPA: hypothetical protein VJZ27_18810, partial [Aggregatilineales bacterium]|nr:hypothetical protein [Aggregatilineales bacterium]
IPEGDGVLMALMLLEVMGAADAPLHEIIDDLQMNFGPTFYRRNDLRLKEPVPKSEMVSRLSANAPQTMAGETVRDVQTTDGVKYVLVDESWLLIRPSGTEPVLRVYAEGTSQEMVDEMLAVGRRLAGVE